VPSPTLSHRGPAALFRQLVHLAAAAILAACAAGDDAGRAQVSTPRPHALTTAARDSLAALSDPAAGEDSAGAPRDSLSDGAKAAVAAYRQALTQLGRPGSIAKLYARARDLDVLMYEIEGLLAANPEAYEKLEGDLRGIDMWVDETVGVEPDLQFFAELARNEGNAQDKRYFALLEQAYPDTSPWPVWLKQVNDAEGRLDLERVASSRIVAKLAAFLRKDDANPYRAYVEEMFDDATSELVRTQCFPQPRDSTAALYTRILPQLDGTAVHDSVAAKLDSMKRDGAGMRFSCRG
jgi:hypothetical protein